MSIHHLAKVLPLIRGDICRRSFSVTACLMKKKKKKKLIHIPFEGVPQNLDYIKQFEPPGLDIKPEIPEFPTLQLRIQSYDFVVLEDFTRHAHKSLSNKFSLSPKGFAVPAETKTVQTYKHESDLISNEFHLSLYERVIEFTGLQAIKLGLLVDVLQNNLPPGVTFSIVEPTEEMHAYRYIPDLLLNEYREELAELEKTKFDF